MTEVSAPTGRSGLDLAAWRRRLQNPLTVATGVLAAIYLIDGLDQLASMITVAVGALANTAPYIAIAVLLIGLLKATGAEVVVARAFQGRESVMIVMAALLGGLAPFCSCEVIPFIAGLMAFWLSAPLMDPPTLFVTAAALGWPFAIGKAAAAVGLGLFGGFAMRALVASGAFADPLRERRAGGCCGVRPSPFSGQVEWAFWRDPARRLTFYQEAGGNAWFLLKWLTLAYVLEAVMIEYVPAAWVAGTVGGDGLGAIAIAAVVGMPAYLTGYARWPNRPGHERGCGDRLPGRRRGQLDPGHGGGFLTGKTAGVRQLSDSWPLWCDSVRGDLPSRVFGLVTGCRHASV